MSRTLDQFAAECRRLLSDHPGTEGREKVTALVADVLKDKAFVDAYIRADGPERKVLYEDPDLGFTILAHAYQGAKTSQPHDHGPTWAIYGQASGETVMTDWECLARPAGTTPGKARRLRDYTLRPGMAYLYEPGVLHSPRRDGATSLLRIEGVNVEKIRRLPYQAVEGAVSPAQ
jgi:predicted metal-dependent enzyme (double-stranded beta helix superfamily)